MHKGTVVTIVVLLAAGCGAGHRPPKTTGDPSLPSIGWVIMHGDSDNPDAEFGCQSSPLSACAVSVSTPDSQRFAEVHVYYHAGRAQTQYTGTIKIGFFRAGSTAPPMAANTTVKAGDVGNQSVVGIVTDKPGRYVMNIDVTASGETGEQHITQDVPIDVQPQAGRKTAN